MENFLQKLIEEGKIWTLDWEINVSSDKTVFIWCLIISYVDQPVPGVHKVCEWNFLPRFPHVQEELEIVESWVNQELSQCMCLCFSLNWAMLLKSQTVVFSLTQVLL